MELQTDNLITSTNVERLLEERRCAYADEARRLIDACRDLIAETATTDPPVSAILDRAGLASRAFYRLFSSKNELLVAVLQDGVMASAALLDKRLSGIADAGERIDAWIHALIDRITGVAPTGSSSLMLQAYRWEAMFPPEIEAMRELLLIPLIAAIDACGPDRAADPHAVGLAIYDMTMGTICRSLARNQAPDPDTISVLIHTARQLAIRPATQRRQCDQS